MLPVVVVSSEGKNFRKAAAEPAKIMALATAATTSQPHVRIVGLVNLLAIDARKITGRLDQPRMAPLTTAIPASGFHGVERRSEIWNM